MGLFSSKLKTTVGTSVMRAIKDELLPNAVRTGVSKAMFQSGDIPDYIMEEIVGGIAIKADSMYNYGARKYVHGLPSGQFVAASQGVPQVTAILTALEGAAVTLDYCHMAPPNSLHIGWMQLIAAHGYNPTTNQLGNLSTQKGKPVFLNDLVVGVPKSMLESFRPGALDQWGVSAKAGKSPARTDVGFLARMVEHSPILSDVVATDDYVRVHYAWSVKETQTVLGVSKEVDVVKTGNFDTPITDSFADNDKDYFHVKYTVGTATKYWMYRVGSGEHPTLDTLFDTAPTTNGTFFPFAYFRYDKKSEIETKGTEAYKTSKRLVKYLGIDYNQLAEAIDENPDIADVQQAMLVMAVPANTENELEQRYLFDFFSNLYMSKSRKYQSVTAGAIGAIQNKDPNNTRSSLVIQDKRFKMALSDAGVFKRRVVGSIGAIGKHTSGMSSETIKQEFVDATTGETTTVPQVVKHHFYRRQVSTDLYDEVLVVDLQMLYYVMENYTTTGDETDDILLIPIDRSVTKKYSVTDREELYARSLHYIFNSVVVTKVKWYQQGWFAKLIQVVGIVLTILTVGTSGPLLAAFTAATGIAITTTVMIAVFNIIAGMVMGALLKLFVKAVGVEIAFLAALVMAAYGMVGNIGASTVANAPWAKELLEMVSGLARSAQTILSVGMEDIRKEFDGLASLREEKDKMFATANKLLETNNHLSPFVIFGESPNDFYNRTVHAGNVGMNGISAISSYVDIALKLPTLDETVGETAYG